MERRGTAGWSEISARTLRLQLQAVLSFFTMCLICIDFDRGALKLREAKRALGEMRTTLDAQHLKELEKKLEDAEREQDDG